MKSTTIQGHKTGYDPKIFETLKGDILIMLLEIIR